jgi:RNA polymerase sigma-70 factor (ECF subfamily)
MSQITTLPAEDLIPTRYSLLSRLQNWDDQDSWRDFFDTYWRLIYSIAIKSGLSDAEAQDVVQETILCAARDISKFKRDPAAGSFKGWLRNLTRWRIIDQLRKRRPNQPDSRGLPGERLPPPGLDEIPSPDMDGLQKMWEAERQSSLIGAAVQRIKHRVKEEHFQIFELCVLRQWPAGRVAQTLEINLARVYLAKHRVLTLVKKEVLSLENNGTVSPPKHDHRTGHSPRSRTLC